MFFEILEYRFWIVGPVVLKCRSFVSRYEQIQNEALLVTPCWQATYGATKGKPNEDLDRGSARNYPYPRLEYPASPYCLYPYPTLWLPYPGMEGTLYLSMPACLGYLTPLCRAGYFQH